MAFWVLLVCVKLGTAVTYGCMCEPQVDKRSAIVMAKLVWGMLYVTSSI